MLTIPKILDTAEFYDLSLDYKWNENSAEFYAVDAENEKFSLSLWKLNHKATYGLTTALCEWIYWRVAKHIDKPLVGMSLGAQWASIINRMYSFDWNFGGEYISDNANGPIWAMLTILETPRQHYYNGIYFINIEIDKLAKLARHIAPDKKFFDSWLSNIVEKAAKLFPAQYDRKEIMKNTKTYEYTYYDSSNEPPIPREFFFTEGFDYETADISQLLNDYLSKLSWEENNLLTPPDDMLAKGFQGTPYKYEQK